MKIGDAELEHIVELVQATAGEEVMPRFRRLTSDQTVPKTSAEDIVTVADKAMETSLGQKLRNSFPDARVVGEEAVFADPSLLDRIAEPGLTFILDPIDGTWNFANGLPVFGVMVAAVLDGKTIAGLIYDPVCDDYIAARPDRGAWYVHRHGKARLKVASDAPVSDMIGLSSTALFASGVRTPLALAFEKAGRMQGYRCSAHEYRLLCQGSVHFGLNAHLSPWDHAAGQLIHAEAGGHSALLDGQAYMPTLRSGNLLLAPSWESWNRLRDLFGPVLLA